MNSLHFVLLNQNGMGKTALIIFYSNPTYLNHLLLSPVRSDMSAISSLCCASDRPKALLIHDSSTALSQNWERLRAAPHDPHGSNSEAELSWAKPAQKWIILP